MAILWREQKVRIVNPRHSHPAPRWIWIDCVHYDAVFSRATRCDACREWIMPRERCISALDSVIRKVYIFHPRCFRGEKP